MFDGIGRHRDEEAAKRRLASLGLTTMVMASAIGFSIGIAAVNVANAIAEPVEDPPMVFVDAAVAVLPDEAPPPPPARRGKADPAPDPDQVAPLSAKPVPTPVVAHTRSGTDEGTDDGADDGHGDSPGGHPQGRTGGTGDTQAGPRYLHAAELDWVRPADIRYPRAARQLRLGDVSCLAEVRIDPTGKPLTVTVKHCPSAFHASAEKAILRSRWSPPLADGVPVQARTLIRIHYRVH